MEHRRAVGGNTDTEWERSRAVEEVMRVAAQAAVDGAAPGTYPGLELRLGLRRQQEPLPPSSE